MAVRTDTADEEVDAACFLDHLLIVSALCLEVLCVSVEDVDVLLRAVDVVEEVVSHERMVALWVRLWQAYILVHVEGEYMLE